MVFSSYIFVAAFLPLTLIGYYMLSFVKNSLYQRLFLIGASLFFYGFFNVSYLLLIGASIVVNYAVALVIQAKRQQAGRGAQIALIVGVLFNIALIGYFKYYDFFIENLNLIAQTSFALKHIILPLGISFFTFQQLSFLVSVYKGEEEVERLRDYCLFVTFFPQLVAGPIVLYSEMMPQFKDENKRFFNAENFSSGLYLFVIGLLKKAVIADTIALFVDNGFSMTELSFTAGWIVSLSYTLQIYFDFSGYSDMAVGLGRMFNIKIPFNFLSPYKSDSISEFWRRWHITLGRALSTYVYKPLGGNRGTLRRTCINLFLTFMISGLWHGAAWTFVLWGALHGLFVVIERLFKTWIVKIPKGVRIAGTFLVVNFLWVLFRAETMQQALVVYRGMFNLKEIGLFDLADIAFDSVINFPAIIDCAYVLAVVAALLGVVFCCKNSAYKLETFKPSYTNAMTAAIMFCIAVVCFARESVFIYFNF